MKIPTHGLRGAALFALLTLALGLALTTALSLSARAADRRARHEEFMQLAMETKADVEQRMVAYEQALNGAIGLIKANGIVSRATWAAYVRELHIDRRYPGMPGIGFGELVTGEHRAEHVQRMRRGGADRYVVWPDSDRPESVPVVCLEPFTGANVRIFGFDMTSEPVRRAAMERARDSGEMVITPRIRLMQSAAGEQLWGIIVYAPVYRPGQPTATVADRHAALLGFVYGPMRAQDFFRGALGRNAQRLQLRVRDGIGADAPVLFSSEGSVLPEAPGFAEAVTLRVHDRTWVLELRSLPGWRTGADPGTGHIVLIAGIMVSLLAGSVVWSLASTRERAFSIAAGITANLEESRSALSDSERRFRSLFDHSPLGMALITPSGTVLQVNPALCRTLGLSESQVCTRPFQALFPTTTMDSAPRSLDKILSGSDDQVDFEGRLQDSRGRDLWVFCSASVIQGRVGEPFSVVCQMVDITERRASQAALRASEERFRVVFEKSSLAHVVMDAERIVDCNQAALRLLRAPSRSDVVGRMPGELCPALQPDGRTSLEAMQELAQRTRDEGFNRFEFVHRRVDGTDFHCGVEVTVVRTAERHIYIAVWTDLTERKASERAMLEAHAVLEERVAERTRELELSLDSLRQENLRRMATEAELSRTLTYLRTLLSASPIATTLVVERRVMWANEALERITGYNSEELIDSTTEHLYVSPEHYDAVGVEAYAVMATGQTFEAETVMRHRAGRTFPTRLIGKAIDPADPGRGSIWLLQDITVQKTGEAMLKEAKDAAEAANLAKSEFLANMSHELRTPMHAIISFARLGLDRVAQGAPALPRLHQYFQRIDQSSARLLRLLNDLLDLSKMEAMKAHYDFVHGDVAQTVAEVLAESEGLISRHALQVQHHRNTPDTHAWLDPARIAQVLRNLIANAVRFSPRGGTITIDFGDAVLPDFGGDAAPALLVSVSDQGVGIPEGELEAIFDKFVQSSKTKSGAGGTGLGLAICREIIQGHGGRIWAASGASGGATVTFLLQRHPRAAYQPESESRTGELA